MISKSLIKDISSLKIQKHRKIQGRFIIEGVKMVEELIDSHQKTLAIFALEDYIEENQDRLSRITEVVYTVNEDELYKISSLKAPNKVVALMKNFSAKEPSIQNQLVLVLDDIKDPGNLGTIIRLSDWFGIKHIICSENTVELYNPKTIQSSMGSLLRVNINYFNLRDFFLTLPKSHPVFGTLLKGGNNIYTQSLKTTGIIIIGSESHGISPEIRDFINHPLTIPSFSQGLGPESLNASTATSIILSEFRRSDLIK